MRLFVLPDTFSGQPSLELKGKDYNYIVNVLRLKEGKKITGRDKDGKIWNLSIDKISGKTCILSTLGESDFAEETTDALPQDRPLKKIVLYQCLPKGRKLDDIVRKATEIGVAAIVLVKSKNCIANIEGKEESRLNRYETLVKEAVQQSGSLVPTRVFPPIDIEKVPEDFAEKCKTYGTEGLGLFLHQCKLKENQSNLYSVLKNFEGTTAVLIGAEGGFTDSECQRLLESSFKAILLKTNILRCETASVYAISAIQTLLETDCQ